MESPEQRDGGEGGGGGREVREGHEERLLMPEIPKITQTEALGRLAQRVAQMGSQGAAARRFRVSPSYLAMVLSRQRPLGPTLAKVVGLKAKRFVVYRYEETR